LIVFANSFRIQTKYKMQILALSWFSIQLQKKSVFKYNYKYVSEHNPEFKRQSNVNNNIQTYTAEREGRRIICLEELDG